MKKSITFLLALFLISVNVQAQMTKEDRKNLKKEQALKDYQLSKDLVNSNAFTFVALQANPLGGQRFFLNTRPNYINIDGEQVDIYLPYFGAVRMGNGYSPQAGIGFTGQLENYRVKFNDDKQSIVLSFEIQNGHERFEFNFNIYRGGTTYLEVASSRRNSISYNGSISPLESALTN